MDNSLYNPFKTKLTHPIRRIIMVFLIISFFVISPLIILYTAGYRYNFEDKQIKQTGVVSVDVEPKNVEVWLNNIKIKKKIPIRLTNRAPGTYHLKIEKPGYKTWEKDITISSNQTTYIKDITLLNDDLPVQVPTNGQILESIYGYAGSQNLILVSKSNDIYEVSTLDIQTEKITPILRTDAHTKTDISISPFNSTAFVLTESGIEKTLRLFSLDNTENPATFSFFSATPLKYQWKKDGQSTNLYVQVGNAIQKLDSDKNKTTIANTFSKDWYIDNLEQLWTVEDNKLIQKERDLKYTLEENIERIVDISDKRIILQTENKTLVLVLDNEKKLQNTHHINGKDLYYKSDTREWWVWSQWELSGIYEDGGVNLLNRSGKKIKDIKLLDQYGLVLFSTENGLAAFNPGYYTSHELLNSSEINDIYVNLGTRQIYFLGQVANKEGLYKLEY